MARFTVIALVFMTFVACGPEIESDPEFLKGGGSSKPSKKSSTQQVTTFTARTTDAHQAGSEPQWKNTFPIHTTYDVFFALEIGGTYSGHHTATFEIRMPDGTTYQSFEVPFATDTEAFPGEQQAEAFSGGWRVWTNMPVAGTMIEMYGLSGTWSVAIYVDGASTPTASASFLLE